MSALSPYSNLTRSKHQVVPWFSLTLKIGTSRAYLRTKIPGPVASGSGAFKCTVQSEVFVTRWRSLCVGTFVNQVLKLGVHGSDSR